MNEKEEMHSKLKTDHKEKKKECKQLLAIILNYNMCKPEKSKKGAKNKKPIPSAEASEPTKKKKAPKEHNQEEKVMTIRRRGKRTKQKDLPLKQEVSKISRVSSSLSKKHAADAKSGGIEAILPSFAIVVVLACAYLAKSGFRGRSSVAGIDLGTTNSVICVQQQAEGGKCSQMYNVYISYTS